MPSALTATDQWPCRWRSAWTQPKRVCSRSRSKVTWYGHFSTYTKIASTTNMTRSSPNLHTMVRRRARIHDVLKVKFKVKGHVIRALLAVMSRNVCYTVRSHVLSLHALTLWNPIILSFQYKYQAARCLNIGMSYSVIDGLVNYPIVVWNPYIQGTPANIHIYCEKLESLGYIFAIDSMGLSLFKFSF